MLVLPSLVALGRSAAFSVSRRPWPLGLHSLLKASRPHLRTGRRYLQALTCYRRDGQSMDQAELDEQIAALAVLADPTRRRLYFFVASRLEGVGREEAAETVGVSRALAAFHLDRLVGDGLLVTEYRRLTGRTGPGAGRPAKLYRRSDRQLAVSLPQRNYELLARLLAPAPMAGDGASSPDALAHAAPGLRGNPRIPARGQARPRPGPDPPPA